MEAYRLEIPECPAESVRHLERELDVSGPLTKTVYERGRALARDLVGSSQHKGSRSERVATRNGTGRGSYFFVDAFLGKRALRASYALRVSVARP